MSASFTERFSERAKQFSAFCLGMDPTPELLQSWGLSVDLAGLKAFDEILVEVAKDATIVKPQLAFYEQFGPQGLVQLEQTITKLQNAGVLVLVDCKKGDISHTMMGYCRGYLGPESAYHADAITITPYLGAEALHPCFEFAKTSGAGIFVVVRSSNPEGGHLQQAQVHGGGSVATMVAKALTSWNETHLDKTGLGCIGAVVGATLDTITMAELSRQLPFSLMLTPGLGAQGASYQDLAEGFKGSHHQLIPTSSRGVLKHGPDPSNLRAQLKKEQQACWQNLLQE